MRLHGSTPAELREHYMRWRIVPLAVELLRREGVGSFTLAFVWFWDGDDDYLDYEVHESYFVSPSPTPGWPLEKELMDVLAAATHTLRGVPYDPFAGWEEELVAPFAPFVKPGCDDTMSLEERTLPYAVARMNDGQLQVEIVGKLQYPEREVSPLLHQVVPRVERARCGEPIADVDRRLAPQADAQLDQAIEMASILLRNAYAQLNCTVGDPNGDARVLAWLHSLGYIG